MKLRIPVLAALLTVLAGNSYAVNILVNEGFESGSLAPWFNSNDFCFGCTWSVTGSDSHTGSFSATVTGNRLIEQHFVATPVSLISEASLWLKMPGTGIAAVYFLYSDSSFEENVVSPTSDWTFFDVTSFLDAGKSLVGFGVYGCSGCVDPGSTFADDFVVDASTTVPEPSSLLLLGLGTGALALRRRRA